MDDEVDVIGELVGWAHRYNAYERLADGPEALSVLLQPCRREFAETGEVPEWCGVDLLRGWMFWLARTHRFGDTDPAEWIAVENALLIHPAGLPEDRPVRRGAAPG